MLNIRSEPKACYIRLTVLWITEDQLHHGFGFYCYTYKISGRTRIFRKFAFENKPLETFHKFWIHWKRLKFKRCQIWIGTSSHLYWKNNRFEHWWTPSGPAVAFLQFWRRHDLLNYREHKTNITQKCSPFLHLTVGLTRVVDESTDVAHAITVDDNSTVEV